MTSAEISANSVCVICNNLWSHRPYTRLHYKWSVQLICGIDYNYRGTISIFPWNSQHVFAQNPRVYSDVAFYWFFFLCSPTHLNLFALKIFNLVFCFVCVLSQSVHICRGYEAPLGNNFTPICRNNIHRHRITRFHWRVNTKTLPLIGSHFTPFHPLDFGISAYYLVCLTRN